MKKPYLSEKAYLNIQETIEFFGLSARKFSRFLKSEKCSGFLAFYHKRPLILREVFEEFLEENPKIKEELMCREMSKGAIQNADF